MYARLTGPLVRGSLQVWSIAVNHDETRLITGSAAPNLRIYRIAAAATAVQKANKSSGENSDESEEVRSPTPPRLLWPLSAHCWPTARPHPPLLPC